MKILTLLFTIYALLFTLPPTIQGEDASSNLASLTTKFQELITELGAGQEGSNNYENELTTMLQKLDHLSISNARDTNLSVEWFVGPTSKVNPMRVILVVSSFEGMYLNSGIGTFYASLADFLVSHGHTVTILYTRTITSDASFKIFKRWQASCESQGIVVARLDPPTVRITSPALTQKSYWVYQYLKKHEQDFDVVHFPDWEGPGYFATLAKHQGLAFTSKILIVGLHGPWRWVKYGNQQALNQVEDLETDWLERRSIELADALVTPSADLPKWLAASGWSLSPTRQSPHNKIYLMPFLPGKELVMAQPESSLSDGRITVQELVFFGRLEARKGLVLFSDALDIIHQSYPSLLGNVKITFLGRNSKIERQSSTSYMAMRAKQGGWSFEVNYVHHKDRKGALGYLQETGKGRVAVMPSLVDNAPYTLYECLIAHIPFVASNLASIIALVHPESREQVLFSPDPESLASSLQNIITSGAIVARSLMSIEDSVGSWESFYTAVSSWRPDHVAVAKPAFLPKVSVCITHFNRPQFLPMAIQSVLEQDYPLTNVEVVVIDDGSTDPDAIKFIANLQEQFKHRDWQVVQTENKYLGAARNTAARIARGEYLLFLDDDNIAHSKQLSTYVSVALNTGAELLTASHDVFSGNGLPDFSANTNILTRSVPLGPAAAVGLFKNCFGDANFFIKRETFISSGGFTEEKGVGAEDYEFLAKVVLSGVHLEAIPEALLYYRMHNTTEQMLFKTNAVENQVRSARPYASVLNPEDPEATSVLKALAQRRARAIASADVVATCNITVNSVTPNQFSTLTAVKLNFSSLALDVDCEISSILVGSYPCTSIAIGSKTSFTCLTAVIPIPGTYSISVTFVGDASVFYTGIYVEVTAPSMSSVLVGALFKADPGIYTTFEALFGLFASIAGVNRSWFTLVADTYSTSSQRSTFALENHQMQLSISSNVASPSATDVFQNLAVAVQTQTSKFSAIGVTIQGFFLMATCDASGDCDCAPNYAPPTCTTKALCPNNCTGNGDCVDGNLGRVCSCHSGYTGRDCSTVSCKNGCSGHGSCVLQTNSAVCLCDSGWNGDACDIALCPNNCNNVGQCVNGTCSCPPGSSGADCSGTENSLVGEQGNPQQKDNTVLAVVVSVVGAIFLIVVGLIIYIVIERRRR